MIALLDTHIWLWMLTDPDRLSGRVRELVEDPTTQLLLSAGSAWEIAIKFELGRLDLPEPPEVFVPRRMNDTATTPLPIDHADALAAGALPPHHRDPFDRLLVAQARNRTIPLISTDPALGSYDVEVLA